MFQNKIPEIGHWPLDYVLIFFSSSKHWSHIISANLNSFYNIWSKRKKKMVIDLIDLQIYIIPTLLL